jgi:ABC-2 type transport system permease protein
MKVSFIKKIVRYVRLYFKLGKTSFLSELTYGFNFVVQLLIELGYQILTIATYLVIYSNVDSIGGWEYGEMLFLIGLSIIVSELFVGAIWVWNLQKLPYLIKRGELDLFLTKPVDSQFWFTLGKPYISSGISTISGLGLIIYTLVNYEFTFAVIDVIGFGISFIIGFVCLYALLVIVASLTFIFINSGSLTNIGFSLSTRFLDKPFTIYRGFLKWFMLLGLPVLYVSSLSSYMLFRGVNWIYLLLGAIVSLLFLMLSRVVWKYGLSQYTSATS